MTDSVFFKTILFFALAAVFFGDVQVPQTVPLSILIALFFILRLPYARITFPVVLLTAVICTGLVNLILSGYYDSERDFVIYHPVVYGLFVLLIAGGFQYDDRLRYAFVAGAIVLCGFVYWAFSASLHFPSNYYQLKLIAETPLGRSNYLAAFLGFLLVLFTFWSRWLVLLVFPAFLLTMSRTGVLLMVAFLFLRFVKVRRYAGWVIVSAALSVGLLYWFSVPIGGLATDVLEGVFSAESFHIRTKAWLATIDVISSNPLFGVPRGYYHDALEKALPGENLWDPHNSVLHALVSFGLVGFVFYLAYITMIFLEIYRASFRSEIWRGVCWGYSLILVWSLAEPLLLTPAMEILQAYLFVLARKLNRSGNVVPGNDGSCVHDPERTLHNRKVVWKQTC